MRKKSVLHAQVSYPRVRKILLTNDLEYNIFKTDGYTKLIRGKQD